MGKKKVKLESGQIYRVIKPENKSRTLQVVISEEEFKKILVQNKGKMYTSGDWKTPLSLIIAIMLVFATGDFKTFFSASEKSLQIFFALILFFSFLWLVQAIFIEIKKFIDKLK